MKTIASEWTSFETTVVSKDAGPEQLREQKMTFYAGFMACLARLAETATSTDSDKEYHTQLNAWFEEGTKFFKDGVDNDPQKTARH